MLQELRYGARSLLKQPGFSLIAALTLAIGIGSTSAVFSLIQGVLLTPPPYDQPARLVLISSARNDGQPLARPPAWPAAQWLEWQKEAKSLESIAGYGWTFNFLVSNDGSESFEGMAVTREYFQVTGLKPLHGRVFQESDTAPNAPPVMILGFDAWQRKFGGDPNIVGKTLRISRREVPPTVVGVMPPGVRFLPSPGASQEPNYNVDATVDFWMPVAPNPARLKQTRANLVGRLRPGATVQQAQGELTVLAARQAQADRDFDGFKPDVQSLPAEMNRDGRRILLPLLGASALVLLIACGNAAALLLVRGLQRQQEYAVRSALGVSRIALFRQASSESVLLALLGGTLGIGLAFAIVKLFQAIGVHAIPRLAAVTTGWPVLVFGFASALLAAIVAGLYPAVRACRLDPIQALKNAGPKSSAGRGERRLLRAVTLTQTALTLALLVGAGLLIRTMINLANAPTGYAFGHVLTMSVTAVQGDTQGFHRRALDRVAAIPGVQHAAFGWGVPLTGNNWPGQVDIEGQPAPAKASDRTNVPLRSITPDYFKLLGLRLMDGREFRPTDERGAAPVAIVNAAFAARYFPGGSAVGKKIWMGPRDRPANEIVGVVSDGRSDDLSKLPSPEIYLSFWQNGAFSKHLLIRTESDPRSMFASVQRELRAVDGTVAVENVKTLDDIRGDSQATRRFAMQLLVGFSVVGSVLTLVGIYGVLSLSVASRKREIAIRTAVGAEQSDIRNMVVGEGFRLIAGGVVAGIALAVVLSRVLMSFLYDVAPADPLTLIGVALLFTAVALLACWAPTRRAAKVNPIDALRYE
jgi:putative ABC transport system permease protein